MASQKYMAADYLQYFCRCLFCALVLILLLSVIAFTFTQTREDATKAPFVVEKSHHEVEEAKVMRIMIKNKLKISDEVNENIRKELLSTSEAQKLREENRKKRERSIDEQYNNNQTTTSQQDDNYEEQRPVLVHAESLPTLGRRQDNFGLPPTNIEYPEPYHERPMEDYDDAESSQDDSVSGGQVDANPYVYGLRHPPGYYDDNDDGAGDESGENAKNSYAGDGRGAQNDAYDSYYRQWHYATPAPMVVAPQRSNGGWGISDNRKLQNGESDPYNAYDNDDYEYPGAPTVLQKQQYLQQQQQRQTQLQLKRQKFQNQPKNRPQQTAIQQQQQQLMQMGDDTTTRPTNAIATVTENPLISTLKSLKTMWDIYQAFSAAWNMIGTHRQKQEQQQQQQAINRRRQQQITQQTRINSKKPPKFQTNDKYTIQRNNSRMSVIANNTGSEIQTHVGGNGDNDIGATIEVTTTKTKRIKPFSNRTSKKPKIKTIPTSTSTTTTTTTATTEKSTSSSEELEMSIEVDGDENEDVNNRKNMNTKNFALVNKNSQGKREKRQMSAADKAKSSDVGESRYIKGDPLKGYYDFVITEGSYKFWAVFQTGTALLIIYSTFAAIYYSKVNPLVTDYDYTDYLGGARSLSGNDADFIDDDDDDDNTETMTTTTKRQHSWFNLYAILPRAGRTMKYILESLDKLPVDHREADEVMKGNNARARRGAAVGEMEMEMEREKGLDVNKNWRTMNENENNGEQSKLDTTTQQQQVAVVYAA